MRECQRERERDRDRDSRTERERESERQTERFACNSQSSVVCAHTYTACTESCIKRYADKTETNSLDQKQHSTSFCLSVPPSVRLLPLWLSMYWHVYCICIRQYMTECISVNSKVKRDHKKMKGPIHPPGPCAWTMVPCEPESLARVLKGFLTALDCACLPLEKVSG